MELTIGAKLRTALGKQNNKLRKTGALPAVLYGPKQEAVNLEVAAKEFEKVYRKAGENTLVSLAIEGQGQKKVLIHEVAKHYMKNEPTHVDFYEVDLSRKIHAKIPVVFEGVAPAIKEHGGVLVKNLPEIEVEALPTDLPHDIKVDIGKLVTFEDVIRVSDLRLPGDVKILSGAEDVIALVQAPRSEAELADLEKSTADAEKAAIEGLAAEPKKEGEGESGEEGEKKTDAAAEGGAKSDKKE